MCMLADIPSAAYQAISRHIKTADVANLRLISSAVCKRTTQHAPYVCLRLSPSSSPQYPEAWCQATQQLQHIQVVHINISGAITLEVFEAALQSLSKHRRVTALHLLGERSAHSSEPTSNVLLSVSYRGCIPSLQPIVHLKATLKTLVITDLEMENFASDLQQLSKEPAGTFQLQNLTVTAGWHCSKRGCMLMRRELCTALLLLARSIPRLQQLSLRVPPTSLWPGLRMAFPAVEASEISPNQLEATAVMMGVARAVARLRHLQSLTVTDMPDPWAEQEIGPVAAAKAAAAFTLKSAPKLPSLKKGADKFERDLSRSLPFAPAAAALSTMDSAGCWLMQQQPRLKHLHLGCGKWSICWGKNNMQLDKLLCNATTSTDSPADLVGAATASAALVAINAEYSYRIVEPSGAVDNSSSSNVSGSGNSSTRHLSRYSARPTGTLLGLITCCKLDLSSNHVNNNRLQVLLQKMPALTKLEVSLSTRGEPADAPVAAVVTAAASVTGLKCLKLCKYGRGSLHVTANLLLPLTAAAGGPTGLQELHLTAPFAAKAIHDDTHGGWLGLGQLTSLRELSIEHIDNTQVSFPVDSLPASLEVFRGQRLVLESPVSVAAAAAADGIGYTQPTVRHLMCSTAELPRLRVLNIMYCQLSDPSILASKQLEVLMAGDGSWQGGWSAAATAWPAVKHLVCSIAAEQYDDHGNSVQMGDDVLQMGAAVDQQLKDVCCGFPGLKSLMVKYVPYLNTEVAEPMLQQLKQVQHVSMVTPDYSIEGEDSTSSDGQETRVRSDEELQTLLQQQLPWAVVDLGPQRIVHSWEGY